VHTQLSNPSQHLGSHSAISPGGRASESLRGESLRQSLLPYFLLFIESELLVVVQENSPLLKES